MRRTGYIKNILKIIFAVSLLATISCSNNNHDFIEFTEGRSMDPKQPRSGIKLIANGDVYYCKEIMLKGESESGFDYHTRKYEFFKSKSKIDFEKYKIVLLKNMAKIPKEADYRFPDATLRQIEYKLNNKNYKTHFYHVHLNEKQESIYNEIWKLIEILEFKKTDSISFNKNLLDSKLPAPPKL